MINKAVWIWIYGLAKGLRWKDKSTIQFMSSHRFYVIKLNGRWPMQMKYMLLINNELLQIYFFFKKSGRVKKTYPCSAASNAWRCWFPAAAPAFPCERGEWRNPLKTPSTLRRRRTPCVQRWPSALDGLQTSATDIVIGFKSRQRGRKMQSSTSLTNHVLKHFRSWKVSPLRNLILAF